MDYSKLHWSFCSGDRNFLLLGEEGKWTFLVFELVTSVRIGSIAASFSLCTVNQMMGLGSALNLDLAAQTENLSFSLRDMDKLSFNRPGCGTSGEQTSANRRKLKRRQESGYSADFPIVSQKYMGDF